MARDLGKLPQGTWLHFSRLPFETTEEDFAAFLRDECGIRELKTEHVSVRNYVTQQAASAVVAITREAAADLVNWAIDRQPFNGATVVAMAPRPRT